MIDRSNISLLIFKYLQGSLNEVEQKELNNWVNESPENQEMFNVLTHSKTLFKELAIFNQLETDNDETTTGDSKRRTPFYKSPWKVITVAAALVVIAAGIWFFTQKQRSIKQQPSPVVLSKQQNDSLYKRIKVALILADSTVIDLDTARNGSLAQQGTSLVTKHEKSLIYKNHASSMMSKPVYNTISTKKGAKFKLELPDGSTVWLNDSSSIRFPASFTGNERRVEITGEAYFEVTSLAIPGSNKKIPFIVTVVPPSGKKCEIEVVGTQFNVNAYADLNYIKTTVLNGVVKVINGDSSRYVKKGERAQWTPGGSINVDTEEHPEAAITWKDKVLILINVPIKEVLLRLERCYNVHITYPPGSEPDCPFSGKIPTTEKISDVLTILEDQCGVHYDYEPKE